MANCPKCGATKLRKNSRKEYSCLRCGPKPKLSAADGIITDSSPLHMTVWERMKQWRVVAIVKALKAKKATVAQRPDRLLAAGITKLKPMNEAENANSPNRH
jgi:hypothetical protein